MLYCPTDEFHRWWESQNGIAPSGWQLLGYAYIPGRSPGQPSYNLNVNGVGGWCTRKRFGGPYRNAPVMADKITGGGTWNIAANQGNVKFGGSPALSNHLTKDVPAGSNFLFEDGHVEWRVFNPGDARGTIDVGASRSGDSIFFKIPNVATNS